MRENQGRPLITKWRIIFKTNLQIDSAVKIEKKKIDSTVVKLYLYLHKQGSIPGEEYFQIYRCFMYSICNSTHVWHNIIVESILKFQHWTSCQKKENTEHILKSEHGVQKAHKLKIYYNLQVVILLNMNIKTSIQNCRYMCSYTHTVYIWFTYSTPTYSLQQGSTQRIGKEMLCANPLPLTRFTSNKIL
jgi:hypothetical protein